MYAIFSISAPYIGLQLVGGAWKLPGGTAALWTYWNPADAAPTNAATPHAYLNTDMGYMEDTADGRREYWCEMDVARKSI